MTEIKEAAVVPTKLKLPAEYEQLEARKKSLEAETSAIRSQMSEIRKKAIADAGWAYCCRCYPRLIDDDGFCGCCNYNHVTKTQPFGEGDDF